MHPVTIPGENRQSGSIRMNPDEDIYNQPTEAFAGADPAAQIPPTQAQHMPTMPNILPAPAAPASAAPHKRKISRRALIGASLAGVAGASIGGFAVEQMLQRGGLNTIFHLNGSAASTPQIGHLLRR